MEDRELESALRQSLAADGEPSERVWQKLRKPEPRWVPSFGETSVAVLVGVVVLAVIARPDSKTKPPMAFHQASLIERTFVSSIRTGATLH